MCAFPYPGEEFTTSRSGYSPAHRLLERHAGTLVFELAKNMQINVLYSTALGPPMMQLGMTILQLIALPTIGTVDIYQVERSDDMISCPCTVRGNGIIESVYKPSTNICTVGCRPRPSTTNYTLVLPSDIIGMEAEPMPAALRTLWNQPCLGVL